MLCVQLDITLKSHYIIPIEHFILQQYYLQKQSIRKLCPLFLNFTLYYTVVRLIGKKIYVPRFVEFCFRDRSMYSDCFNHVYGILLRISRKSLQILKVPFFLKSFDKYFHIWRHTFIRRQTSIKNALCNLIGWILISRTCCGLWLVKSYTLAPIENF